MLITGPVGAGKSTLLTAMLGEVPQLFGSLELLGSVAYCPQMPWILTGTIQHNITFGDTFQQEKFDQVVQACCLAPDFRQMNKGAETIIGERGITLSGGQKARISLARAAYSASWLCILSICNFLVMFGLTEKPS